MVTEYTVPENLISIYIKKVGIFKLMSHFRTHEASFLYNTQKIETSCFKKQYEREMAFPNPLGFFGDLVKHFLAFAEENILWPFLPHKILYHTNTLYKLIYDSKYNNSNCLYFPKQGNPFTLKSYVSYYLSKSIAECCVFDPKNKIRFFDTYMSVSNIILIRLTSNPFLSMVEGGSGYAVVLSTILNELIKDKGLAFSFINIRGGLKPEKDGYYLYPYSYDKIEINTKPL